ncbi:MAG: alkaline phosphatase [Bacteroidales bacterium]|nr:alkaline phosphatase [Bacteroidales bacterium]MDD4384988.1 alkaline phosphatase [Bacteroidales bacterium]MDY0196469.1 alkaline phosphatase [Tenuifilaceae bacterium]
MKKSIRIAPILIILLSFTFSGFNNLDNEPKAKYVFYFIGDGMGIQQINAAQAFLNANQKSQVNSNLSFTEFPVVGFSTTYAYNRYITGSAAAGTALSTGTKTSINTLGLNHDHTDTLFSIAYYLNKQGFNVGIATSVSIDHATPAAFYAHQPKRNLYHEIAHDMLKSHYRFFAGGGFLDPKGEKSIKPLGDIYSLGSDQGIYYTSSLSATDSIVNLYSTIVYQTPNPATGSALKYQIDNAVGDVALPDITAMGIEVLKNKKGFFFMVEGGKIDWACHDNDAASVVHEVIDFSNAIQVAVDFYKKYPKETLIVITADHETGGMSIGNRKMRYDSDISLLANQKISLEILDQKVQSFFELNPNASYKQIQDFIFSDSIISISSSDLNEEQNKMLKKAFEQTQAAKSSNDKKMVRREYGNHEPIAATAIEILNQMAGIGWSSFSHTASPVPVYALGVGQEKFCGQMDNTDVPKRIASIMGISME